MTANHIPCATCHKPIRRGDAVIRGDLHEQTGWHPACWTVVRATAGIDEAAVVDEWMADMPLTRRLAALKADVR